MKRMIAAIAAAIGIAAGAWADPIDLATLEYSTRMGDGIVLTGELKKKVQISIMDGATVTLKDITIHGVNDGKYKWAGITCEGDATLVLEGGNAVIGFHEDYPGVYVPPGKTLTIKGWGTLSAGPCAGGFAAGIGGGWYLPCGNIVIDSGNIYAQAFSCAAGIGGVTGVSGDITINGGTVIAKGGYGIKFNGELVYNGGAGIGGGHLGSCGNITINGGNVSAEGGTNASGIGAASTKSCGNITISGGTVTAKGCVSGAGIGSAFGGAGNILISGGTVRATGGETAPGIGAGENGSCASITITKGVESVSAVPGNGCENHIGAGVNGNCPSIDVASELPSVTSGRTRILGKVVNLDMIFRNATIPDGVTLTGVLDAICKISIADGATVTLRNVSIKGEARDNFKWAGLTCLGNATIVLDGHNVIYGYQACYPGIYVPKGSTVTIQGTGSLHVVGSNKAAGIGGGEGIDCGNIVIRGGSVHAGGGDGAAGIGGGKNASCGNISIRAGIKSVRAVPGDAGSTAIGAGTGGTCGTVLVEDGLDDETDAEGIRDIWPTTTPLRHLDRIASDTTFKNGDILTGTLDGNYKISIADGAMVTLSGTTINGAGVNDSACNWAGLTCLGDATIILEGVNVVRGFYYDNSGIFVPAGKTLTIRGSGSLEAYGGMEYGTSHAAGIGAHRAVSCGNIVIEGGNITAIGKTGIGCGNDSSVGNISILGGSVFAEGEGTGIGGAFNSARIGDIFIGKDIECVIAKVGFAGREHDIIGVINDRTACGTITVAEGLSETTDADGLTRTIRSGDLSKLTGDAVFGGGVTLRGTLAGRYKVSIADGATVTLQDVTINGKTSTYSIWKWAGLTCEGDATIILAGDNTVKGFDYGYPGIFVPAGKTLTIKGTGSLAASSNDGAAGIGGGIDACGNIVIEGGSIEATGSNAAGIGGGDSCGDITILGGIVKAKGSHAAGIGSDSSGECGTITISSNGGIAPVVEAVGGSTASGIGGADGGYCGNIRIESGYVVATGGKFGSGIGGCMKNGCTIEITGGTVEATGGKNAPGIGHDGIWSPCGTITIGSGIDQVTATAGEGAVPIAGWDGSYETAPVLAPGLNITTEGATSTIAPPTVATYKVRYRKYDGSGEIAEEFLVCGKTYTLAWLGSDLGWSRPGYEFCGWVPWNPDTKPRLCKYDNGQPVKDLAKAGETIDLWAGWKSSSSYRVCFHRCAGPDDLTKMNQVILRNKEDSLAWMDSMIGWKRDGYTFLGWDESDKASTVKYANGAKVKNLAMNGGTKHLYAVWRAKDDHKYPYTVKYYKYDGSGETRTQSFKAGTVQSLLWMDSQLGWSRPGYEFVGWVPWNPDTKPRLCKYANGQKVVDLASKSGEVVSLYPAWKSSSSYRVCFNRNDGTGVKMNQVILRNKEDNLAWMDSQIGWKREGYVFKGWAESASGAVKYANGAKVKNLAMDGGTKHLYAIWRLAD